MHDVRIAIAQILREYGPLSLSDIRFELRRREENVPDTLNNLVCCMVDSGYIERKSVCGVKSKYLYSPGPVPVWGVYGGFHFSELRYKILYLADRGLERNELADILKREGNNERCIYSDMVKLYTHGLITLWGPTIKLTRLGREILDENRITARPYFRGKTIGHGEGIRGIATGQNEGISIGGVPS